MSEFVGWDMSSLRNDEPLYPWPLFQIFNAIDTLESTLEGTLESTQSTFRNAPTSLGGANCYFWS